MTCLSSVWGWVLLIAAIPGIAITTMLGVLLWQTGKIVWEDWKINR